ncbi:hypothetical protein GCM10023259_084290 [Thermocatellispora tengchongensis]
MLLGLIMTMLDGTIVNVAVGAFARDFGASVATIQWVLTGYLLALSMAIPVTGWAMARFGVRRMWVAALLVFTAGSVLCGAAWSIGALIVFRLLQVFTRAGLENPFTGAFWCALGIAATALVPVLLIPRVRTPAPAS